MEHKNSRLPALAMLLLAAACSFAQEEQGELGSAINDRLAARPTDPTAALTCKARGDASFEDGEYAIAVADYTAALRFNPMDADIYCSRGVARFHLGQYDQAIDDFSAAIRLDPNNAYAYFFRGGAFGEIGEYNKAIRDYTESILLQPDSPFAYYGRGYAWRAINREDQAQSDFDRAIRLDAERSAALSDVPPGLGGPQQILAEISIERALSMPPEVLGLRYLSVESKIFACHSAEMGVTFQTTLDERPVMIDQENVRIYLPALQRRLRTFAQAIRQCGYDYLPRTIVARISPGCKKVGIRPGPSLIGQSDFKITFTQGEKVHRGVIVKSTVILEHALNQEFYLIGQSSQDQIDLDLQRRGYAATPETLACRLVLRRSARVNRMYAASFLGRAVDALANSDFDRALADLNDAIRLDSKLATALALRSRILSSAPNAADRDGKQAVDDATRACELTQWRQWGCLHPLANAYAETGDFDAAIQWGNRALQFSPPSERKKLELALELYRQGKPLRLTDF